MAATLADHAGTAAGHVAPIGCRGLATLGAGCVLVIGSNWLATFIVRVPFEGCPRCGYAAAKGKCTECGMDDSGAA